MDLRKLRYFVAAAEQQNFRLAAEISHISQPALSKQIALLEQDLGCELFIRSKRRVRLSPVGEAFLVDARRILREIDFAVQRVARAAAGHTGILRVGFRETAGRSPVISRIFREFKARYPDVELHLTQMTVDQVCENLIRETLHIGLSYSPPANYKQLASLTVERERAHIAMPAQHPLARRDGVRVADLAGERFIWFVRSQRAYYLDAIMERFVRLGMTPDIVQEASNEAAMLNFVSLGLGICPVLAVNEDVAPQGIVYKPIVELDDEVKLEFIWLKNGTSPMTLNFLDIARDALAG